VFELAQLPGLNNAGKRAPAGTKNPGAGYCPEGGETGLSKAGLKGEQKRGKGTDQQIGHRRFLIFHFLQMKDTERKKSSPYCRCRLRSLSNSRLMPAICFSNSCV
jgi:hypothetical protein